MALTKQLCIRHDKSSIMMSQSSDPDRSILKSFETNRGDKGAANKEQQQSEEDAAMGGDCTWYEMEVRVIVSFWMGRRSLASTA